MKKFNANYKDVTLLLFILVTGIWRVMISSGSEISVLSNFTPLGAMALFGGAYLSNWKSFAFPLLTIWLSDVVLNKLVFYGEWVLFYDGFVWTYGAFALMVLVGKWMKNKRTVSRFLGSTMLIVFVHWIVTDIGVWIGSAIYPQTLAGFWMCLVAAIPFELRFLASSLLYGGILFGSFEWIQIKMPIPVLQKTQA